MNTSFEAERVRNIEGLISDRELKSLSEKWMVNASKHNYSYNFSWLGRPIIQFPQDIIAMQELIWKVRPDMIIETGIAHGGSLIFYASMMELLGSDGLVVGIDIDIRRHNRNEIEAHPLFRRIQLIVGDSVGQDVVDQVHEEAFGRGRILVVLDSKHTHDHVLKELDSYSSLVTKGSYIVVFDTIIEDFPEGWFSDRPWDKGNNPKTAVDAFLAINPRFRPDKDIEGKLLMTVAPGGYLECIAD